MLESIDVAGQTKQRVLLVDDEPQMLVALEDLLGDAFDVLKTTSPQIALEMVRNDREIAVVITDQRMPKMTGEQMLSSLQESCDAQRIMVTGFADLAAVIRAVNEGKLFAYVTKPWNADDLQRKVDQAARQFRQTRSLTTDRKLLQDLMQHSPDGIFFKDRELRFVEANLAFRKLLGLRDDAAIAGKRLEDLLKDPELAREIGGEEQGVLALARAALDGVRRYDDAAHGRRWLSETRAPVRDPQGAIVGLVGISRDVSERVEFEQALREGERQLRGQTHLLNAVLEGMAEGVVVCDLQGTFLLCNQRALALLGPQARSQTAQTWLKACGLERVESDIPLTPGDNPLLLAVAGARLSEVQLRIRRADQSEILLAIGTTPLREENGEIVGGIALLRDITSQRQMEQRLAQAQKMDAVGRLAGGIAHDFNNLLSVIQCCGDILQNELPPDDSRQGEVTLMLDAAQRAAGLTNQLLSFSRQQVLQPKALQLNGVLNSIATMLRRAIGAQVELELQLEEPLGLVKMDGGQLERIVMNLAVNARDAMPEGGKLRISTRNQRLDNLDDGLLAGDYVVLTIRDSGTGISAEVQARMFEPFYTTKAVGKGSGLGLSTVYGIVEQSGGHLRFQSAPGAGTEFRIYLPRCDAEAPGQIREPAGEKQPASRAGTILLVEDADSVRRVLSAVLRKQGYLVLEASRPSEALQICADIERPIDLLLTDIVMPDGGGPQLVADLRKERPALRLIYMSGYSGDAELLNEAIRSGAKFLQKPFSPASLTSAVAEALER